MSVIVLLTILFVILKMMGFIAWAWIWVVSPIWIGIFAIVAFLVAVPTLMLLVAGFVSGVALTCSVIIDYLRKTAEKILK